MRGTRKEEIVGMKTVVAVIALCASIATAQTQIVSALPQPAAPANSKESSMVVVIETTLGRITAELYPDKAPLSVSNFLAYVDSKFYDGTIFHRVIPGFMIQGGGFTSQMRQKPTQPPVKNEAGNGLKNDRGTLAMARTMVVECATAQFFINHKANAFRDLQDETPRGFGYTVFGKVTEGLEIVDKIAAVQTGNVGPFQNVPLTPVSITSIRRQETPAAASKP